MIQKYFIVIVIAAAIPPKLIDGVGIEIFQQTGQRAGEGNFCYTSDGTCLEGSRGSDWNKGKCTEDRQSPIDVPASSLSVDYATGCPVDFGMTEPNAYNLKKFKAHHTTITLNIVPPANTKAMFRWPANNDGTYTLAGVHFHWGETSDVGSEHKIDGKAYAMEMHLVHYRSSGAYSFGSVGDAIKSTNGNALAVIGVMLNVNDAEAGSFMEPLLKTIERVPNEGNETDVGDLTINFHDVLKRLTKVMTYEGSLTTPPCSEIVQWIVALEPVHVKASQVEEFRKLSRETHTYRKLQKLNKRTVKLIEVKH